ncbi:MAG: MFS transporter, partial [Caulobacterales bacterium]
MRNASLLTLVGVVLVAMTGFGIFLPIFPFLALSTGASASTITLAMGAYSLGQFIAAPLWGKLSDRIGRKPVLVIGLAVTAIAYVLLSHAQTIWEMGAARLFGGLMAGNAGAAFAAAADMANDKTRARNMGLLGAAVGVAFILGPAIGALLVGPDANKEGFRRVCIVAAAFAGAAALAALLLFKETISKAERTANTPRQRSFTLLKTKPALAVFIGTSLLFLTAQALMETAFGLWANAAFAWGPHEVGWTLAAMGLGAALLQGGGAGAAARRWGERSTLRGGLAALCWGLFLLAAARVPMAAFVAIAMITLGIALATPALQSLVAAQTEESVRGAAMGLNQSAQA